MRLASFFLTAMPLVAATIFPGSYVATPCGRDGQVACSILQGGSAPTAQDTQGLSSNIFASFYQDNGYSGASFGLPFTWYVTGASADGYVIGGVDDLGSMHGQFIYRSGVISCCEMDDPFNLSGINNQDLVIGWDPNLGESFLAMAGSGGPTDVAEYTLPFLDPSFAASDPYLGNDIVFQVIDDQNSILAYSNSTGQQYMFVDPPPPRSIFSAVVEPNTVFLLGLLLGLGACAFLTKRVLSR